MKNDDLYKKTAEKLSRGIGRNEEYEMSLRKLDKDELIKHAAKTKKRRDIVIGVFVGLIYVAAILFLWVGVAAVGEVHKELSTKIAEWKAQADVYGDEICRLHNKGIGLQHMTKGTNSIILCTEGGVLLT